MSPVCTSSQYFLTHVLARVFFCNCRIGCDLPPSAPDHEVVRWVCNTQSHSRLASKRGGFWDSVLAGTRRAKVGWCWGPMQGGCNTPGTAIKRFCPAPSVTHFRQQYAFRPVSYPRTRRHGREKGKPRDRHRSGHYILLRSMQCWRRRRDHSQR